MKCSLRNCTSGLPAIWEPTILVWPDLKDGNVFQPASISIQTMVCDECRKKTAPVHYVTADMWKEIIGVFRASKKSVPSFRTAKITFTLAETFKNGGILL